MRSAPLIAPRGRRRSTAAGVQTGIHYPTPIHLLPAHADLGYREGQFPHSERAAREVLSLPMFPELTGAQVEIGRRGRVRPGHDSPPRNSAELRDESWPKAA